MALRHFAALFCVILLFLSVVLAASGASGWDGLICFGLALISLSVAIWSTPSKIIEPPVEDD